MTQLIQFVILFGVGLIAGFMSGMFGIGGGSVRIPLLNLAGLHLLTAFAINLFVIPFSSSIGAITQRRNVDRQIAVYVITGGTLGSVAGAFIVGLVRSLTLAIIFVLISIISVLGIYLDRIAPGLYQRINPSPKSIIPLSFLLNLIAGMRGGSGGSLFPSFLRAMKLDIHKAVATSLVATIFTALPAIIVYWNRGDISWLPAVLVLVGSMMGARIGSKMSLRTKPFWLELGLSILVIVLAFIVLYKALL